MLLFGRLLSQVVQGLKPVWMAPRCAKLAAPALASLALVACGSPAPVPADGDQGAAATAMPPLPAASRAAVAASAPEAAASAPMPPASAPRPARAESQGYATHWQRPVERAEADGVAVVPLGWRDGVRLLITSSSGIGQVEVRPRRGGWPNRVELEFQYAPERPFDVLEGLRLQVINPAHTAGDDVPPLVPDDFSIWQRDGRFWVELPNGWLRGQQGLRIGWVDRYRY